MRSLFVLALAAAQPAFAADAYLFLTIEGQEIEGPETRPQVEQSIPIANLDFSSVLNATTHTLVVGKLVDQTSPLLHDAVVRRQNVTGFELVVVDGQPDGSSSIVYTLEFTGGVLTAVDTVLPTRAGAPVSEQLTFAFEDYTVTWSAP